jgi:hypothetical protein
LHWQAVWVPLAAGDSAFVPQLLHTLSEFAAVPVLAEYFPAAQSVHTEDPAAEYLPATQSLQTEAPAAEYLPATQSVHALTPVATPFILPAGQRVQMLEPIKEYLPAPHSPQPA